MKNQLFPEEFIQSSVEHYTFKIGRSGYKIYSILIAVVVLGLALLPFVTIEIHESSTGRITSESKKHSIATPASGRILYSKLKENHTALMVVF